VRLLADNCGFGAGAARRQDYDKTNGKTRI